MSGASSVRAVDGTLLAYTALGSGPSLVCLAGGPGRASAYLEDLGGLSQERTLVLLDARGTGSSQVPADPATLRFDRLADDVEALRAHLGEDRIDLLGHSAGAVVAQTYAATHPDRLRSLVLVTPSDGLQGGTRADVPAIRASRAAEPWYADAAAAQAALDDPALDDPARDEAAPDEARAQQRTELVRAVRPFLYGRWDARTQAHAASADVQSSPAAEAGFSAGAEQVDVPALLAGLARVDVPVLVVGAERDATTGIDAVHAVARCFPRARTAMVPRAGHFPWVDEPAEFRSAVTAFLRGV